MGRLKQLALLIDEYRESAALDLAAAALLIDGLEGVDLDPDCREKTAMLLAMGRAIEALHAQATSNLGQARFFLNTVVKMGGNESEVEELKATIDALDERRRAKGDA